MTAIGSVGDINAPNNMQYSHGNAMPSHGSTSHMALPINSVDSSVPTSASVATWRRQRLSACRSMCSAPANSKNDNMPCISTSEKSMARRNDSS